jgi:hypothetical protein
VLADGGGELSIEGGGAPDSVIEPLFGSGDQSRRSWAWAGPSTPARKVRP